LITIILNGFLLGFSTGAFCLGSCLPILLPFILVEKKAHFYKNLLIVLKFSGGRLVASLMVGFIVGYLGKKLAPGTYHPFMAVIMVLLSLLLICYGLVRTFPRANMSCQLSRITS